MPREFTFRDARVRSPSVLALNAFGRVTGFPWRGFDADAIVADARRHAGLDDPGDGSWREPLDVLCDALPGESGLTSFGRTAARAGIVGALANRLRVVDWAARHPEVHDERVERPWVIVGMPRTGTSLLSFLMELDPHARTPTQWEALDPIPPPELATYTTDPRIAAASRQLAQLTRLCPPLNALHPMDAGLAAEDVSILMYGMRSWQFETLAFAPGYGRWLDAADMRPTYALFRTVLQIWQSTLPVGVWSLKCPQHLMHLDALLDVFPDARLVWIHRDPVRAVGSLASMVMAYLTTSSRGLEPARVAAYWTERMVAAVDRASRVLADRDGVSCVHVHYEDLMKDPVRTLRGVRAASGEPLDPLHQRRIEVFMRTRPRDLYGRHVYRLEDFGLTASAIDERFASYVRCHDVGPEAR